MPINGVEVLKMSEADYCTAFCSAVISGTIEAIDHVLVLAEQAGIPVSDLLQANDFLVFRSALVTGNLEVVNHVLALAEQSQVNVSDMLKINDFLAIDFTIARGHMEVVERLLEISPVTFFAYMEQHREFSYITFPQIEKRLHALRHKELDFRVRCPNGVFDLEASDGPAEHYFFIIRHLIRRSIGNELLLDQIRFLLELPSVRALAAIRVNDGEVNELFRLAARIGNAEAVEILLSVPAVYEDADANGYYAEEAGGAIDLRALARDRESSMRALSIGEQRRLSKLEARYGGRVLELGVHSIMNRLRETLKLRYERHPVYVTREDGSMIELPFDWGKFESMAFSAEEREAACKAYYQDLNHTAYYYLSKPNPRISPHAGYVYINDARTERWSTFEDYQPLIARLFLAASDELIETLDGYTPQARFELFIRALSLIARAHNWDRARMNAKGERVEYDDLEGDKPSCFSGVKRRLFQSVLGHPDLVFLTADLIHQALQAFIRGHLLEVVTLENIESVQRAWDCKYIHLEQAPEYDAVLKTLNIDPVQIEGFKQSLREQYGDDFSRDIQLNRQVDRAFQPDEVGIQLAKLSEFVDLPQLLDQVKSAASPSVELRISGQGFFNGGQPNQIEGSDAPQAVGEGPSSP